MSEVDQLGSYITISVMEGQDSFIMRQPEDVEAEFGEDDEDVVADAGNNANQGTRRSI